MKHPPLVASYGRYDFNDILWAHPGQASSLPEQPLLLVDWLLGVGPNNFWTIFKGEWILDGSSDGTYTAPLHPHPLSFLILLLQLRLLLELLLNCLYI